MTIVYILIGLCVIIVVFALICGIGAMDDGTYLVGYDDNDEPVIKSGTKY